jgi:hypothetical protein
VVVWDLDRGVVASTLVASEDQAFLAVAANQQDQETSPVENYYILVRHGPKLLVQEYQESNNKVVRKIKSGHLGGKDTDNDANNNTDDDASLQSKATLFVTDSRVVVRTMEGGIRIMDKDSGKKTGKIKIKSNSSGNSLSSPCLEMNSCVGDPGILVAMQETGAAFLYDMSTTDEVAHIPPSRGSRTSTGVGSLALQLAAPQKGESSKMFTLLLDDHFYSVTTSTASGSTNSSSIKKLSQVTCENPTALFLRSNHKVLAVMYQRSLSECNVEWIDLNDDTNRGLPHVFKLGEVPKNGLETGKEAISRREKRRPVETKVLGPGQAGIEALPALKKMKKADDEDDDVDKQEERSKKSELERGDHDDGGDDDDDDGTVDVADGDDGANSGDDDIGADDGDDETKHVSIAERLQQMTDALEAEEDEDDAENDGEDMDEGSDVDGSDKRSTKSKFKAKGATTESLKEVLTQALQSSDDSLLELALSVRDVKIIATSLRELDDSHLVTLLGKLTIRLASTPLRAENLSVWLSQCLKYGSYQPEHLAVLRNLLYERIESFSDLLRLEGRLSMMITTE